MQRGDIYLVALDPTAGHEQRGTRPVLIVSPTAFNQITQAPVVLPITSGGDFARTAGFAVPLAGAGTRTNGIVRCDQPRTSEPGKASVWKAFQRILCEDVLAKLAVIFE
jgi:mRNA-degrading endonuclease toxin of MazEF toxin-antitoxin module